MQALRNWNIPSRRMGLVVVGIAIGLSAVVLYAAELAPIWQTGIAWEQPKVVDPGPPGGPPSDAIVLFDGKDLSQWENGGQWLIQDGCAIAKGGSITTRQSFGDCQLHLEWASPAEVKGSGQARGNSGVFLMDVYEVQILDSYSSETYFDGCAGAIYKQRPPLVNACRKPGEWQNYDIIFKAPRFDPQGKLLRPAYITILHNGVLIQDHFEIVGITNYRQPPKYEPGRSKGPIRLQYHNCPVRFRNIWVRELGDDHDDLLKPLREQSRSGRWVVEGKQWKHVPANSPRAAQ